MKTFFITYIFFFTALILNAQDSPYPNWLWAKSGGSTSELSGASATDDKGYERIVDLAIDSDNNYYFVAEVGGFEFQFDGMEFNTYNDLTKNKDLFLFSTDSDGNYRWSKTIGGGHNDYLGSIVIDEENYIYITVATPNYYNSSTTAHFDEDYVFEPGTSTPGPNNKKASIIKYSSEGELQWFKQPEGDEVLFNSNTVFVKTITEPNGTTHSLVWFAEGTHLNGQLIVPEGVSQAGILIYDNEGIMIDFIPLNMKPYFTTFYHYQFAYDSNLDRYYIGDTYRSVIDPNNPLSINGYGADTPNKGFYIAAVDNQGEVVWYHENHWFGMQMTGDIQLDNEGNIYFTGATAGPDTIANYVFNPIGSNSGNANPFLLKFNSNGDLLWGTNPDIASPFPGQSIVIAGNDVYLGLGMLYNTWDSIEIPKVPLQGYTPDIVILRFDAQTGIAQELIYYQDTPSKDMIMAIEMDSEGALVVGGYFNGTFLFHGSDFQLNNFASGADFFIAKYQTPHTPNAVREIKSSQAQLFPNPTGGVINVKSSSQLKSYSVYDLQGKLLSQGSLNTTFSIDVSHLHTGIYVVEITTAQNEVERFKVVRE